MTRLAVYPLFFVCLVLSAAVANGQPAVPAYRPAVRNPHEPGWARNVITSDAQQALIDATPIQWRPYRPGHVYGNTIRRRYYRGRVVPAPRDAVNAAAALAGLRPDVGDYVGYAGP